MLESNENFAPDVSGKLGFQAHYPQLEVKLSLRGSASDELLR